MSAKLTSADSSSLDLSVCREITNVEVLQGLKGLQSLNLSGCRSITNFDVLQGLTGLKSLYLSSCTNLKKLNGL